MWTLVDLNVAGLVLGKNGVRANLMSWLLHELSQWNGPHAKSCSRCPSSESLTNTLDTDFLTALLAVVRRMIDSVTALENTEITPRSFEQLERRLERLGRGLARLILEHSVNRLEAVERPPVVQWSTASSFPIADFSASSKRD